MADPDQFSLDDGEIRETYREYAVGQTRVATIADPRNDAAWIQSTCTSTVEP